MATNRGVSKSGAYLSEQQQHLFYGHDPQYLNSPLRAMYFDPKKSERQYLHCKLIHEKSHLIKAYMKMSPKKLTKLNEAYILGHSDYRWVVMYED